MNDVTLKWLLEGDVSLVYKVMRDLLETSRDELQSIKDRIALEGFGIEFLSRQNENGHWGQRFYQPKWISSHYTLLDLRNLCINSTMAIDRTLSIILDENISDDGGVNPARSIAESDVCINGMFLRYACYFGVDEERLKSIVDFVLSQHMSDGGYNCQLNRSGAHHSSVHSTMSCLEGIREYEINGYTYRLDELLDQEEAGRAFMLEHHLYKSHRTGQVMQKGMTMLSYPSRWKFDVLRGLDYFVQAKVPYDPRLLDSIELLVSKQKKNGRWPLQAKHPGQVHFEMEQPGKDSRMNTFRAIRALEYYDVDYIGR